MDYKFGVLFKYTGFSSICIVTRESDCLTARGPVANLLPPSMPVLLETLEEIFRLLAAWNLKSDCPYDFFHGEPRIMCVSFCLAHYCSYIFHYILRRDSILFSINALQEGISVMRYLRGLCHSITTTVEVEPRFFSSISQPFPMIHPGISFPKPSSTWGWSSRIIKRHLPVH